jgi:hypothetical protein
MKTLLAATFSAFAIAANAQELPLMLPYWAISSWNKESAKLDLRLSTRINPFVWRGDFNADSRSDLAVFVESTVTGKQGILFLLQRQKSVLVGAGVEFGNGGDDFAWMDVWHVEDRGTGHGNYTANTVRLKGDGLMVAKESSASALIYWKKGRFKWQQYGD